MDQVLDRALAAALGSLSNEDMKAIANGGVKEDGVIEFKSGLDEGSEAEGARWAAGGKLVRPAKADLVRAVIAFANSYGGTLFLGISETDDDPKRSRGLSLVPRIAELEAIFCDVLRETVEPRLPTFETRSFVFEGNAGVLAVRVAASPLAPHWNSHDRQCYQRIGASSQRIGMREIQSITLDRAQRSIDLATSFAKRQAEFEALLLRLAGRPDQRAKPRVDDLLFPNPGICIALYGNPAVTHPGRSAYGTKRPPNRHKLDPSKISVARRRHQIQHVREH